MPGPPPSLDPVRRNARSGPLKLPAEGRKGDPPSWPLVSQSLAEERAWADLWKLPQAVAWEHMACVRAVARYCRIVTLAEAPDADTKLMAQAVTLEDRLGLSPKSMRMLLWEIASDDVAEKRQTSAGARGRIKAV